MFLERFTLLMTSDVLLSYKQKTELPSQGRHAGLSCSFWLSNVLLLSKHEPAQMPRAEPDHISPTSEVTGQEGICS